MTRIIKLGSIETANGIQNKQGYNVYSIFGCSSTITADTGGLSRNSGGGDTYIWKKKKV